MSEIGKLSASAAGDLTYLSGHIQTLDGRLSIALDGDPNLRNQKRPSHRIETKARDGSMMEIGSAWLKTALNGPHAGEEFFSLQVDSPERTAPLNVAAFKTKDADEWIIVWRRRGGRDNAAA